MFSHNTALSPQVNTFEGRDSLRMTVLIPAYNEQDSIGATIQALLEQTRRPDQIIVIPNGCSDETANVARQFEPDVYVLELPKLENKKSEALNTAWSLMGQDADVIVCLDADTELPENAIADWEQEMLTTADLGGSSSKFTMLGGGFLTRLQRAEFAKWTDVALARGWTSVLAGTGCAIRNEALHFVVDSTGRSGPWSYESTVEDFELTYLIRKAGWRCQVSPTVRAYTDSMKSVKALWGQRMKWQVGTIEDLQTLGFNQMTAIDWFQQSTGVFMALARILWIVVLVGQIATGLIAFNWFWMLVIPLAFIGLEIYSAFRIPHRDKWDVIMALTIAPSEIFAWLRAGWFLRAWSDVLLGIKKDRWASQYALEKK